MATPLAPEKPTLDTFGAPYENFDAVVDSETEMDATFMNRMAAQLAMISMTAPIAWVRCTVSGVTLTVADHSANWGDTSAIKPTVNRDSAGVYNVSWAETYSDLQDTPETHTVNIRAAQVSVEHGGSGDRYAEYTIDYPYQVYVYTNNRADGAYADVDAFTLTVW